MQQSKRTHAGYHSPADSIKYGHSFNQKSDMYSDGDYWATTTATGNYTLRFRKTDLLTDDGIYKMSFAPQPNN